MRATSCLHTVLVVVLLTAPVRAQDKGPAPPTAPAAATSTPAPLAESLTGTAKADYEAGKLLFGDRDFNGALVKYRSAHEQSKDPRLLWNMAACEKNLRHYVKVRRLLERYIDEGRSVITEQERREARDVIDTIEPFTTAVSITVNEAGAKVLADGEEVGTTPLVGKILLDIGDRKLEVTKDGYRPYVKVVTVSGSGQVVVDVKLDRDVHEGKLAVRAAPNDLISVDGNVVGKGVWTGALTSGGHTLRVTSEGMRAYQTDVVIQDNQTRSMDVALEPAKAGLPLWAWIAGGAVAALGTVTIVYVATRPGDPAAAAATPGTMSPGTVQLGYPVRW